MIFLTNKGNKMANHFALALAKVAAIELNVSLNCDKTEKKELHKMAADKGKLFLFFSDNRKVFEDCGNVVVLWDFCLDWPDSFKVIGTSELEASHALYVNDVLKFWGFERKVLPDFKFQTDKQPTPLFSLEFNTGEDYLIMRIKDVTWKDADGFSKEELEKVEKRIKEEFVELAEITLRKKFNMVK